MEMIRSGDLKFDKVAFEETSVRVYGTSATAVAHAMVTSTLKGKTRTVEERVTFVAVKDGDAWRFVSVQLTPIVAEPTTGNSKTSGGGNTPSSNRSAPGGQSNK